MSNHAGRPRIALPELRRRRRTGCAPVSVLYGAAGDGFLPVLFRADVRRGGVLLDVRGGAGARRVSGGGGQLSWLRRRPAPGGRGEDKAARMRRGGRGPGRRG